LRLYGLLKNSFLRNGIWLRLILRYYGIAEAMPDTNPEFFSKLLSWLQPSPQVPR